MSDTPFTPIATLGRDALIRRIAARFSTPDERVPLGIGDDAAAVVPAAGQLTLVSTETLIEGVDFDLTFIPLHHLGYKAVTAGVSDIQAKLGSPRFITIGLSVPNRISVELLDAFYDGVEAACRDYGLTLIGGDITAAQGAFGVHVTVLGEVDPARMVRRSGARPGDALLVTGDLGAAYAGLKVLLREKKFWEDRGDDAVQPDLSAYETVMRRQLMPTTPGDFLRLVDELGVRPTSMIDISKHLLRELAQLTEASGTGALLYAAAIPIALETRAVADEFEDDVDQYALQGGEDFQFLFTMAESDVNRLMKAHADCAVIGKIVPRSEGLRMQTAEGEVLELDTANG